MTTMSRRNALRLMGLGVLGLLVPQLAHAADIYGSTCTYSVNGLSYSGQCRINTYGSGTVTAYAYGWSNVSSNHTTIGAISYLYTHNGLLCAYSDPNYSQGSVSVHCVGYDLYLSAGTTFCYAAGDLGVYNSDSGAMAWYDMLPTSSTAVLSIPAEIQATSYEVNASGLTYGSGLLKGFLGGLPDLVLAVGINGEKGYVKKTDLLPGPLVSDLSSDKLVFGVYRRTIPVYAVDGAEAIDTFGIF